MSWFGAFAGSVLNTIACLRHRTPARIRRRPRIRYERVDEFPDSLKPATLYVAGEEPHLWAAAMLCPCGCGEIVHLNLLGDARPSWSVLKHNDSSITLMPSIWRTQGCRSHFCVRRSRIDWCRFDTNR